MPHQQPVASDELTQRFTLSTREVAAVLGISDAGVRNLIKAGVIPSLKLGNRRLVRTDALAAVLDRLEGGAA